MNPDLQKACDNFLNDLFVQLVVQQAVYSDAFIDVAKEQRRNRFWQGRITPSTVPTDKQQVSPTLSAKTVNGDLSWSDMKLSLPSVFPCSIRVDEYVSSEGNGWVLRATVNDNGTVYNRVLHAGPCTWMFPDDPVDWRATQWKIDEPVVVSDKI